MKVIKLNLQQILFLDWVKSHQMDMLDRQSKLVLICTLNTKSYWAAATDRNILNRLRSRWISEYYEFKTNNIW